MPLGAYRISIIVICFLIVLLDGFDCGRPQMIVGRKNEMKNYTQLYIDGAWVEPLGGEVIDVINPATEKAGGQITLATVADVDRAANAARAAFASFSRSSRQERLDLLSSILGVYAKRHQDLADALTEELGARRNSPRIFRRRPASCTCRQRSLPSRITSSSTPKAAPPFDASRSGSWA